MKRNSLGTLSITVLSLMLTTATHAQSIEEATVPFTFQAGATQLPAGHYEIKENHVRQSIRIRNLDTGAIVDLLVQQSSAGAVNGKMVFRNIGSQHFLTEICAGPSSLDLTLPASKMEKQAASLQVASGRSPASQNVQVALK